MREFLAFLKNNTPFKILVSIIFGLFSSIIIVFIYGIYMGGYYLSLSYSLYVLVFSLFLSFLIIVFLFGKKFFKKEHVKEIFLGIVIAFIALNFFMYPSLNKLTASKKITEYETEIIECRYLPKSITREVFFHNSENKTVKINYFEKMIYLDDELVPETNGKMIVREYMGGFNLMIYEIVEITYAPNYE